MELQRKHNEQEDDKISPMSSNSSGTFSFHKCGWRLRLWIQNLWDTYITYPSEKIEEEDRISQLPEPIIHKILFRLNTKAVARTSILSKTWQRACSSFHRIDFRENYFNAGDIECPNYSEEKNLEIRRKKNAFMNFIDDSLQSFLEQNLSMTKFTLKLTLHDLELVLPRVAKWLTFATERNVKKLDLSLVVKYFTDEHKSGEYVYYSLPHVVLEARTISVLRLSSCKLEPYNEFKFSDLKILDLRNVQLNEQVIQNLTLSCPLIEDFKLIRCHGFKDLKVSSLLRLNQFFVISCKKLSRIEIEAPSLQTFEFSNRKARRHCEFYLEGCKDLKTCTLRLHRRNNMIAELLQNLSAKCPTLEVLCIERYRLSRMKISCQTLKMLSLVDCKMEIVKISCQELKSLSLMGCKSLEAVELDTPNLVSLNCMMNKLPFYSINTTSLQEVGLTFDLSSSFTLCFDKLKELVGKFNGYEGLNLVIHSKVCAFSFILNFISCYKYVYILNFVAFLFPL
jgi:hypothetical protein